MNKLVICVFVGLFMTSCYYDSEETLYGTVECSTEGASYSVDVLPLLIDNCYRCHAAAANFGGINLEGYDQVSIYVNNGELLGVIRHTPGFSPMPQNEPQLVECNIEKIATWIESGAQND